MIARPTPRYNHPTMPNNKPNLDGSQLSLAILVARFNEHVTSRLLEGAQQATQRHGVRSHEVFWVPGSFELPVVALHIARTARYDAIVCLGAVIRHETDHYLHVATQAAAGIRNVSLQTGVPCLFGVLTCDTEAQALDRAGGSRNAGSDAVEAAIETANLIRSLRES
jgi:6,7-dimethyl-8-ribityllumazine synthase